MTDVNRWMPDNDDSEQPMVEREQGDYVLYTEYDKVVQERDEVDKECKAWVHVARNRTKDVDKLQQRIDELEADSRRFEYHVCGNRADGANALLLLELLAIGGESPSIDEWRAAIDADMEALKEQSD